MLLLGCAAARPIVQAQGMQLLGEVRIDLAVQTPTRKAKDAHMTFCAA
jgi:hypothetical protein